MARFIIPNNVAHTFQVSVKEEDSFLPQDLGEMTSATFKILDPTNSYSSVLTVVGAAIQDEGSDPATYLSGKIEFSVPATEMDISTGDAVDWYYDKPRYTGTIHIIFDSGSGIPDKFVKIDKVYVSPTGVSA